jgi:predicted nucleic acid-binding protein
MYEIFKVGLRERGRDSALQGTALMRQVRVGDLTAEIAIRAAKVSLDYNIPMADSIILPTAY